MNIVNLVQGRLNILTSSCIFAKCASVSVTMALGTLTSTRPLPLQKTCTESTFPATQNMGGFGPSGVMVVAAASVCFITRFVCCCLVFFGFRKEERPDVSSSPSSSSSYHHHFNHQYYYHYHHHCHYHYIHCNCHCHYHYLHHRHVNEALSERAVASALVLIMASARVVQILGADVMAILRKASCHGPDSKLLHYREGRHSDPNARSPGKPWKMGLNCPALAIHYPTCGTHISWGMQALQ